MKELKRLKPYKNTESFETIARIRHILEDCDIFTTEYPYQYGEEKFYSHGILISDEHLGDLQIGTFGKGLTPAYSLASGYAEFIERIQNSVLFYNRFALPFPITCATRKYLESENVLSEYKQKLESENLVLDFVFGPDEKEFSCDEAVTVFYDSLKYIFEEASKKILYDILNNQLKRDHLSGVPFYNVMKEEIEYVPIEFVYRTVVSTGICAGNTLTEAFIHGICEIFERYAVKKIYKEELTPPTIPLEYFKATDIYERIKYIENVRKMNVIIKDCSLGLNLPVIGVLVIDQQRNRYTFNLGSRPVSCYGSGKMHIRNVPGRGRHSFLRTSFAPGPF